MKLTHFLVLFLGLSLGFASAGGNNYSGSYWANGVSETGGWYDANKTDPYDGDADDNMCYAASAANLIAWWQNGEAGSALTSEAPKQLGDIWQTFIDANQEWEAGGETLSAINWWISGVYNPEDLEDTASWERYYLTQEEWSDNELSMTLRGFDGYYYDQYGLTQKDLPDFLVDMDVYDHSIMDIDFADTLSEGCGISLGIATDDGEEAMGHAITLWGVEYDDMGTLTAMWITDSDDEIEGLVKVSLTVDKENNKIWLGDAYSDDVKYYLAGAYFIDPSATLKWPTLQMIAYVNGKVNPTTHNGRAGAALLPEVYLNIDSEENDTPGVDMANADPEDDSAMAAILEGVDAGTVNDRDVAAVAGASAAVLGQAFAGDLERQLRAIRNRSTMGNYSQDAVALDGKSGLREQPGKYYAWINAEGNSDEQDADGTAAGYTLHSWGGTVGAGMQVNEQLTLGLAITAMYGDLKSEGPDKLDGDMDTTYLSAFARYQHGAWSHSLIGTIGTMEVDYKRSAMSYANNGDTDGTAFGLMYELSRSFTLNDGSNISPVFNVSYRHTAVDGYNERGTDAALHVGKQNLNTVTLALGARYAAVVGRRALNCACLFDARALAKYDLGDTQCDTSVGFVDYTTRANVESAEKGALGLELGAGISVPVGTGSIFTDGSVELRNDYTNFNATVGYRIQF